MKDKTFARRIRLYAIGFLGGCVVVYFMLISGKDYGFWYPSRRVKEKMLSSKIVLSKEAAHSLQCRGLEQKAIVSYISKCDIDFSKSDTHREPCPYYSTIGKIGEKDSARVGIVLCDSTASCEGIVFLTGKDTCR